MTTDSDGAAGVAEIVAGLSEAQRLCGDVLDSLPCVSCGARSLRRCTLPMEHRRAAADLIRSTDGLMAFLWRNERTVRQYLEQKS